MKMKDKIYASACDAMYRAQYLCIPRLPITMPDFSSVDWRDLDVAELEKLVALAEIYQYNRNHARARNAMLQAQDFRSPELGVSWPNFSSEAWRDLDLEHLEQMNFLAEQNAIASWGSEAIAALEEALIAWARLACPRPPRPTISPNGWRKITGGQHKYWIPDHNLTLESGSFSCPVCYQELSEPHYKHDVCQQTFCCKCLNTWMESSTTCPICRSKI